MRTISDFGPVVQEFSFKDISYLELCQLFFRRKTVCATLEEEYRCEIFLNLDQWFRRKCRLKTFLI